MTAPRSTVCTKTTSWFGRPERLPLILVLFAVLYGTSYQQFRHFHIDRPEGMSDAKSYIRMSYGDYRVPSIHRYRWVVPALAGLVRKVLERAGVSLTLVDKLSFYIVNFTLTLASASLLLVLLDVCGFSLLMSLLGAMVFLSSRITVASAATPMVDSFYMLSICLVVLLTVTKRPLALSALCPLLVFSKETILPILFLPLLGLRSRRLYSCSILISLLLYALVRNHLTPTLDGLPSPSLLEILTSHATNIPSSLRRLMTFQGLHDLQNGYSFFLIFAAVGYGVRRRTSGVDLPRHLLLLIPLALFYALMSGNLGRLFFSTSFVAVIPLALIGMRYVLGTMTNEAPSPPSMPEDP